MLDTGLARPPSPTYTAITPVTRAPDKIEPATETDLPAEDTVRPAGDSTELQTLETGTAGRQARPENTIPPVDRQNVIDPDTESVVFVATNTETGEVVRQVPAETLLRLRAYAETIQDQKEQSANNAEKPSHLQMTV